jgi:hypothetical protein
VIVRCTQRGCAGLEWGQRRPQKCKQRAEKGKSAWEFGDGGLGRGAAVRGRGDVGIIFADATGPSDTDSNTTPSVRGYLGSMYHCLLNGSKTYRLVPRQGTIGVDSAPNWQTSKDLCHFTTRFSTIRSVTRHFQAEPQTSR